VLPWFDTAHHLPAEDVMDLPSRKSSGGRGITIAVPHLPRIANFDDLDPLAAEPGVNLQVVPRGMPLPAHADLILLCGSKATLADLAALRAEGWDIDIAAHIRRGGHVLGLCGGYQMLGRQIADPMGIEGPAGAASGLGHLNVETVLRPRKTLALRRGRHIDSGADLEGYEIHIGETSGPDCARGWIDLGHGAEGASSPDGRVSGCYLHGLFASDGFRAAWLSQFGQASRRAYSAQVEETLDALAAHLERHMDVGLILKIARDHST
jgi:adenosylcobyric acid synthase